jgi:hypothetical protein
MLAQHALGIGHPGEAVGLACVSRCAAIANEDRYEQAAMRACLEEFGRLRGWHHGRIVVGGLGLGGAAVRVPSFEIFAVVAETLLAALDDRRPPVEYEVAAVDALIAGLEFARGSLVESPADSRAGWADDQLLTGAVTETWATAAVGRALAVTAGVRHEYGRRDALDSLGYVKPWGPEWPDWLVWSEYRDTNEPDLEHPILAFLDQKVVQPRKEEPGRSRSASNVILLFGPPGTTKTTIARAVANGLEWPLVSLSPGDFIRGGLDAVEARAKEVFDLLEARMRRAVSSA